MTTVQRPDAGAPRTLRLRILATSDLHLTLDAWDYLADRPAPGRGLTGLVPLIGRLRAEADNSLLFDNGDTLFGFPIGASPDRPRDAPQAWHMVDLMARMGFDAASLGNHDFDAGLPSLAATVAQARFPMLLANSNGSDRPWQQHAVLTRTFLDTAGAKVTLRVGVAGLATPDRTLWDAAVIGSPFRPGPLIPAARRSIAALRRAGADIIVVLLHGGLDPDEGPALAAWPHVTALVTGHRHKVFPGPEFGGVPGVDPIQGLVGGKPCVMPGAFGSHLGVIDLNLKWGSGGWSVATAQSQAVPALVGPPPDQPVIRTITGLVARARVRLSRPVGQTQLALDNHLSRIEPDMLTAWIAQSYRRAACRLLPDRVAMDLPLLVAVAPPGGRVAITPGPVAARTLAALSTYPGKLTVLLVTGAQVRAWLDHSASAFARLDTGVKDQPLFDSRVPGYRADQIWGLSYCVDLTLPPRGADTGRSIGTASRIVDLRIDGRPLAPRARALLVTSSYRAGGGGGYAMARHAPVVAQGQVTMADALRGGLELPPPVPAPWWRLIAPPGTSAWFDAPGPVPAARPDLTAIPGAPDGLFRTRLTAWAIPRQPLPHPDRHAPETPDGRRFRSRRHADRHGKPVQYRGGCCLCGLGPARVADIFRVAGRDP
jgi:2',3'-cyclic-nucleotide 2'-phosphodiesterase / 3'-nucleotidase